MCSVGDVVVVMGGLGEGETYLNDLWILDTANNFSWEYVKPGGNYWPKARDSHSVCALEDAGVLVLWGGFDGVTDSLVPPGVIETFDFKEARWEETVTCGEGPRGGANGAVHALGNGSRKMVAISERNGGIFNQMFVLDYGVKPWSWSEISLSWRGDWTMIPGQRSFFSSCYDPTDGLVFVYGGKTGGPGGDGMMHNTLICANVSEIAGVGQGEEEEGEEGEEEEDSEGEREEKKYTNAREAVRGSQLPGQGRFKGNVDGKKYR